MRPGLAVTRTRDPSVTPAAFAIDFVIRSARPLPNELIRVDEVLKSNFRLALTRCARPRAGVRLHAVSAGGRWLWGVSSEEAQYDDDEDEAKNPGGQHRSSCFR